MATLATLLEVVVQADTSNAQAGLMGLNTAIGQAGSNALGQASQFTRLGFLMTGMGLQAGFAAKAMGAFLVSGIQGMIEYEAQARKTWTQVEDGVATLEEIKRVGLDVAKNIAVPLKDVQTGLYDIFSSMTVNMKEAEILITAFSRAAVAGASDIASVSKATIAIMNAWKVPIQDVDKVLAEQFETVRQGRVEYTELASTIGRAIPSAVRAGQSFSDLGGMMAFMTRNGMSAAQSATSAGRALDLLTNPKFGERMKGIGIDVADANGNFKPMVQVAEELRAKLGGLSEEARANKLKELTAGAGGVIQAMRFMDLAILDTKGELREFTENIEKNSDAMEKAYKKMQSAKTAIQLLKNNWEILKMELSGGLGPVLMRLVGIFQKIVDGVMNLSDATKENIGKAIALTSAMAGIAAVVLAVLGAINMTAGAFVLFGVRAQVAARMAALLYGSLALIPLVIFLIMQNWDKLEPYFKRFIDFFDPMIKAVEEFVSTVKRKWDELTKVFREEGWKEGLKALPKFFEDVLKAFKDINIKQFAGDLTEKFNEWVKSVDWGKVGATLGSLLGKAFGTLAGMGTEIVEGILKVMAGVDWASVGARAAVFIGAFLMGAIQGVFSSGILGDIGGMILRNLGPIVETALILALAPPGLVGKLLAALARIPIVGGMIAFFTNALRTVGLGLVGTARFLFLPLTTALSTGIRSMGATLALRMMFIGDTIMGGLRAAFAAVAARVAPLVAPIGAAIATGLRTAAAALKPMIALIFSPLGLLIGTALIAGFLMWKYNDEIVAFFEPIEADIKKEFLELQDEVGPWVQEVMDNIEEFFNQSIEIGLDVGERIREQFDRLQEQASTALQNFRTTITTRFEEIRTSIINWFTDLSIVEYVTQVWTDIQSAWDQGFAFFLGYLAGLGARLLIGIGGMFTGIGEEIGAGLAEIQNQFSAWGAQLLVTISTALYNAWISVSTWASEVATNMREGAASAIEGVSTWFSQLPGRITTFLATARQTVLTNFSEMVNTARTKSSELVTNVSTFFSQLPGRITTFLATARQSILTKFSEMVTTARTKSSELVTAVSTFFSQLPGRITTFLATARQTVLTKFSEMVNTARTKASELVSGFMSALSSLPGQISGMVGRLVASIGSWGGALIAKARSIGASIWAGFKAGLGMSSPSYLERAMDHINEELISKMHDLGPDAARTMARATSQITKAFAPIADMAVGATVSANGTGVGVMGRAMVAANTIAQTPTQAAPLIGQVNISAATPEQAYVDFDRKIVALNMRVGRG